jgi:uncharacterized protein (TIGR00730 family)
MRICVYCSSSEAIDPAYKALARDVGLELAKRGHSLVSGGGCVSMMGEVARAVRAGGGHTIGVIPKAVMRVELADADADELIVTEGMRERKAEMDDRADAFIVLPGGIGTLEELMEIWTSRTLGMHARPVVVLDPDGFWAPFRALVDDYVERGFARPSVRDHLTWVSSASEALAAVE